ncbi:sulfurtransferase TusA family protein [Pleionea sediminis]|uniref:sulfurtransferase TusA family protein n=1 Tax=Pleionea sediminis TaxID=2569479 RepID=UPI001186C7C0|nr:sulfurtransferase TusA family protein [Pleionea sediminis]
MKTKPDANYFDYRQLRCPLSLVRAKLALKQGKKGQYFTFWVLDNSFYTDLKKLAQKYCFEVTSHKEKSEGWLVEIKLLQDSPFSNRKVTGN